jgi:hypothetical protein
LTIKAKTRTSTVLFFAGTTVEDLRVAVIELAEKKKTIEKGERPKLWQVMSDGNADWQVGVDLDEDTFEAYFTENMHILVEF